MVKDVSSIYYTMYLLNAWVWYWEKVLALWFVFFFDPSAIVSLTAGLCLCDLSFDPNMSVAFGPVTHTVCLGSMTLAPS